MIIKLFKIKKRINSTYTPSTGVEIEAKYKNACSIFSPVLIINKKYVGYNYLKINNYYYYINDIIHLNNDNIELYCNIDYLSSFKNDILNTTAYVNYSSSFYDETIIDNRFSTKAQATIKSNIAQIGKLGKTYIMNYVTNKPTYGFSGICYLSESNAKAVANAMTKGDFLDFLENTKKQLNSVYDSINTMTVVPFSLNTTGNTVNLGGYATGIPCGNAISFFGYGKDIAIPWQYTDFRNLSPYTSLLLYLPGYGYLELNPNDFIGKNSIRIELIVDGVTGTGSYDVGGVARCDCNFAQSIPIGKISAYNSLMAVAGSVSAIGGAITGQGIATAEGISSVISSMQRNVGTVGSTTGNSAFYINPNITLTTISHNTNQEPSSVANTIGLNTKQVISLSKLNGYVETVNASVSSINEKVNNKLNNFLNGGIYIE